MPIIADDVVDRGVRDRRGEDHACPRPRRPRRRACATASRRRRSSTTTATIANTGTRYDGLDRYVARDADRGRPRGARRPRRASARTRWSSAAASGATTSSSRGSRPSGSSGPGRSPHARSRRPGRGRTRILPERFEKTWEHWLTNIRDWNVSPPAVVGPPDPGLVLPGRPRDGLVGRGGPDACEVCGRPAAELDPGPRHLRHLVQLGPVAVLDPRLARRHARPTAATTRRRSWRRATTSSSSGSPG